MYTKTGEAVYRWKHHPSGHDGGGRGGRRGDDPGATTSPPQPQPQAEDASIDGDSMFVDLLLDANLGMRYLTKQRLLLLYVCCEGLRYAFVCGPNRPAATWEPPSWDGSWMEVGPGFPAGAGGSTSGEGGGGLPPPPFLNQLMRDSGSLSAASTTRVTVTSASALADTCSSFGGRAANSSSSQAFGSGSALGGVGVATSSPKHKSFSSITEGLRALDSSLLGTAASALAGTGLRQDALPEEDPACSDDDAF